MKNTIKYFYNISVVDIIKNEEKYKILDGSSIYYLTPFDTDIVLFNYIYDFLIKHNIYCHEVILNKDNQLITKIDDKDYIMLKIHFVNKKIDLTDINNFSFFVDNNKCNWYDLWITKIDYYEYQMSQFKKKYPILYKSFSYYSGMSETAVCLIKNSNINKVNVYLSHKRITKNYDVLEFYNPVNIILDVRVRDACEYFKNCFIYKYNPINEVINYLEYSNLNNNEAILFLARMLYPSYYFDLYDLIIQEKENEDKMKFIINKIEDFENFLKEIYNVLTYKYNIPEIEWLIKT